MPRQQWKFGYDQSPKQELAEIRQAQAVGDEGEYVWRQLLTRAINSTPREYYTRRKLMAAELAARRERKRRARASRARDRLLPPGRFGPV